LRTPQDIHECLTSRVRCKLQVTLTRNRVRFLSFHVRHGVCRLRINADFLEADDDVLDAVAAWVSQPRQRCPAPIRAFIATRAPTHGTPRRTVLRPLGRHHDLDALMRVVNETHFTGLVRTAITWGRPSHKRRAHTRRLGVYRRERNVISIHPVLDQAQVPVRFVAYVIYHEMLHALQEPGCRRPHGRDFRAALRRHPDHDWAVRWEKTHRKLLGLK